MKCAASKKEMLALLRERLREIDSSQPVGRIAIVSSGLEALDDLLPQHGWPRGTLVEWLSTAAGSGVWTLGLVAARSASQQRGVLIIVDGNQEFYPPSAASMGINLEQTLILRPATASDALWAWNQALRCPAVGAVWGRLGALDDRHQRRLQLAAEAGGTLGLMIREAKYRHEPSWSQTRLLVEPVADACRRLCRVEVLRSMNSFGGGSVVLELDDEAGLVRVPSKLADSTAPRRAAGA